MAANIKEDDSEGEQSAKKGYYQSAKENRRFRHADKFGGVFLLGLLPGNI